MNSNKLQRVVELLLSQFIAETTPDPNGLRGAARRLNLLPLVSDMGGCYAIQPGGEIVSFPWDDESNLRVETDRRIRNGILYQGSLRYPSLREFVLPRPVDAMRCLGCGGTGKIRDVPENCICECFGLGWLPSTTDQAPTEPA